VPDDVRQATSDHGFDIAAHRSFLTDVIARLRSGGMRVSVFVEAEPQRAREARDVGADRIEIYTGPYGGSADPAARSRELDAIARTGEAARDAGIGLNAGHDLTLVNLPPLVARLPNLAEVSIGHALTADALIYGMAETVRLYRKALNLAPTGAAMV
jgi:pyridoxine 5-phosphate synthase